MTWEEEVKKCHDEMKCKYFHPELGCIAEHENRPHPPECYLNKKKDDK